MTQYGFLKFMVTFSNKITILFSFIINITFLYSRISLSPCCEVYILVTTVRKHLPLSLYHKIKKKSTSLEKNSTTCYSNLRLNNFSTIPTQYGIHLFAFYIIFLGLFMILHGDIYIFEISVYAF